MFNRKNRKNKLLKLLLILPLFIALTIFCYASFKHQKVMTNTLKVSLPLIKIPTSDIGEYLHVDENSAECNKNTTFIINDSSEDSIQITNKTYLLNDKTSCSEITKQYKVYLDDKVYSKNENIQVEAKDFKVKRILYKTDSLNDEGKELTLTNNQPEYLNFRIQPHFYGSDAVNAENKNDIILQSSRNLKDPSSTNPRLLLEIKYILDYQKMKETTEIQKLIKENNNVQSIDVEFEFKVCTKE